MLWWRYIDDVLAIWPHGKESLQVFLNKLNLVHPTIKFTVEWSRESVTFLDTRVIREGNHLIIDLYTKPTNTHQYLHQHSCHPPHGKASIAYSQALRIRRICSKENDYERRVGELKTYLVALDYNEAGVTRQIGKATEQNREYLLVAKIKNKNRLPL